MLNIGTLILLISSSFLYAVSPLPVSVQEDVSFTLYAICSARDSTSSFEKLIHNLGANISDEVINMSYNDVNESKLWTSKAEDYLNKESYDEAKKCAYYSWFLAERASFRIYVNITWNMIQDANKTIKNIPNYIEKPLVAQNTLKNSIDKFESWSIPVVFGVNGPSFHLKGYAVSMNYNKKPLYLDEDSAYQLAKRAKEETLIHLKSQTNLRTQIESRINKLLEKTNLNLLLITTSTILMISSIVYILTQKSKQHMKKKVGNYYALNYLKFFNIEFFKHKCVWL
ncbi:hypothetical protein [[Eubacterium] cellulosolvens]